MKDVKMDLPGDYSAYEPSLKQTLMLARKEADRFHHNYIGTGHFLLGLIELKHPISIHALRRMGLSLDAVSAAVEQQMIDNPKPEPKGDIGYTQKVEKLFTLAQEVAKTLRHNFLGVDHIILSLLKEGDGTAAQALLSLDLDFDLFRKEILSDLRPSVSDPKPSPKLWRDLLLPEEQIQSQERSELPITSRARRVEILANRAVKFFQQEHVLAEHLLLGIIDLRRCAAIRVLRKMNVDPYAIRSTVEQELMDCPKSKSSSSLQCPPPVQIIFNLAGREVRCLNHLYIGTGHILLGILRKDSGIAARTLKSHGMELNRARFEVCTEMNPF